MTKEFDAKQLTLDYFKDFEYNCDGPGTGGHIYSVIKYCHPTEFVFKQNGRADAKGILHQVQVFALYCARAKRRYAHEDFLTISDVHDIEGKPGWKRIFIEREERCYYQDENTPESNYYPKMDLPGDKFLSIVEWDNEGKMRLMADYFDIGASLRDFGQTPPPSLEDVIVELDVCTGGKSADYMEGLEAALELAHNQIYLDGKG